MRYLTAKAPPGNGYRTPQTLERIDDHLAQLPARIGKARLRRSGEGTIQMEADGSFIVDLDPGTEDFIVRGVLTRHYGLEIGEEHL
jgi:hypothetical protein